MSLVLVTAGLTSAAPTGLAQRTVTLIAAASLEEAAPTVIDTLTDGDVLRVTVVDGTPGMRALARQCTLAADGLRACRNVFPVLFDDDGRAVFQYQVTDDSQCGPAASCVLAVTTAPDASEEDTRVAVAFTVFGGPAAPPPRITLTPAGPYRPGQLLDVVVGPVLAGTDTRAAFCAESCGAASSVVAAADGEVVLPVRVGERCERCGIHVVSASSYTEVPLAFVPAPHPRLSGFAVLVGLVAAATLLLVAAWLIVSTDWRPPTEAQTPEFDAVDPSPRGVDEEIAR